MRGCHALFPFSFRCREISPRARLPALRRVEDLRCASQSLVHGQIQGPGAVGDLHAENVAGVRPAPEQAWTAASLLSDNAAKSTVGRSRSLSFWISPLIPARFKRMKLLSGIAHPTAWNERKCICQHIVIRAVRIFRRNRKTPVALVKIAGTGNIGPILCELAVVASARPARPIAFLHPVAAVQLLETRIPLGVGIAVRAVDGKAVRGKSHKAGTDLPSLEAMTPVGMP